MRFRNVCAALLAAGLLAGCGGGGDDGEENSGNAKGTGDAEATEPAETDSPAVKGGSAGTGGDGEEQTEDAGPSVRLQVPDHYDTSRGWQSALTGTRLLLPHAGAVAWFDGEDAVGGSFTVLGAADGETLWTGERLAAVNENETLSALSASAGGQDYLVAWSSGEAGSDVIDSSEAVLIDIFAAEGPGERGAEAVAPTHHVEVAGSGEVVDGGGGLMVRLDDGTTVGVDPATGEQTRYDTDTLAPCADCERGGEVLSVTAEGPVLYDNYDFAGFGVPGAWDSDSARPDNADPDATPSVTIAAEHLLLASWDAKNGSQDILTVVDGATGEVRATALCPSSWGGVSADYWGLSPDGRYLVSDDVVFDLQEGAGHCFAETEDAHPVTFLGMNGQGQAYGTASTSNGEVPVSVTITGGDAQELPEGVVFPLADFAGHGLFLDESGDILVAYAHSE